ncbi:MAG TPA: sialidase family protein [Gaiellaceae bacterium]|nr:sialidase family protein [Gaiellaceae bacterium]
MSGLAFAAPALADVKVTDQPYVRQDGGTDPVIARCSTDNRQQNEPTVAISPTNSSLVTAGSNDYCTVPTAGDAWAGFYYSSDGGHTWTDSLLPGYPGDTSPQGQASPLQGVVGSAGDPVQAWDNFGHLYYGGIAFNRDHPQNGDLWVARYSWQTGPKPQYEFTTLARRGTPAVSGVFNDKIQLEVDRGANSPYSGNVYVCWARFQGNGNNGIFFIRSTDGGRTFSRATKLSEQVHDSQFCDIAVTRTGTVYVLWRGFATNRGKQGDAILFAKSTDGGTKFSKPGLVTPIEGWDPHDEYGSPTAAAQASEAACDAGETALCEGAEGKEAPGDARDCGDGPFQCLSGYVFFRANTQVRASADPRAGADANTVYAVYDGSVPGSEIDTGTSYGTLDDDVGTQASIFFVKTTNGGASWTAPTRIDPQPTGHQFFPDVSADSGQVHVLWQDSRADTAVGPTGDFRQVPIANQWVSSNPPGSVSAGPAVDTYVATSTDGGGTWPTIAKVSTVTQMPQDEQFGNRDIPFFGDYNYIAASGTTVVGTWTDERDTLPGTDPRYPVDGTDGFDVHQCRTFSGGVWSADTCPDDGGLDQNIYGFSS